MRSHNFQRTNSCTYRTNHSKNYPEDACVYEPKHIARNTAKASNKLRVVSD
jgi:hypothetical protein